MENKIRTKLLIFIDNEIKKKKEKKFFNIKHKEIKEIHLEKNFYSKDLIFSFNDKNDNKNNKNINNIIINSNEKSTDISTIENYQKKKISIKNGLKYLRELSKILKLNIKLKKYKSI